MEEKLLVREPDLVSRLLCKLKGVLICSKKHCCGFKVRACEYISDYFLVSLQYGMKIIGTIFIGFYHSYYACDMGYFSYNL